MKNKYIVRLTSIIFFGVLISCFLSSALAAQTQPTSTKSKVLPLQLETFVDRVILKKDGSPRVVMIKTY